MVDITDKSAVSEENQVPVPKDKLKEKQKKEFDELVEKSKRECLKSYSINRSGEVIKKFNLPSFQPLIEAQRENKMMDAIGQAVAQAFIKSATVMGNTVHNAVVKTFAEARFQGAWVLAIYSQIRCSMFPWKYLWQQPSRLKIARQDQATVNPHPRLLLQHRRLQQIQFTQPRRRLLQLCKMDLCLYFLKDGILLLGMACIQISFLHYPRCSLMHRLLSR
jgi:hypothetical protein